MIFKLLLAFLLLSHVSIVFAFDVCDKRGFEKTEAGWIRTVAINKNIFIDFKVSLDELDEGGLTVTDEIAPTLAKDMASNAYYRLYKSINPTVDTDVDLIYSRTESYFGTCWMKKTYGFRTPLSSFQWVRSETQQDDDTLPAVKDFLRKEQLIK